VDYRLRRAFLRNAQGGAERHAGSPCIDLSLAAGIGDRLVAGVVKQLRGLRHFERDIADVVCPRADQRVDDAGDLAYVANAHRDAIAGAVAGDRRRAGSVRGILRLQGETGGLDVLGVDTGGLQRGEHLGHRGVVGFRRLARGPGIGGDAGIDGSKVGRHRYAGLARDRDRGRKRGRRFCQRRDPQQRTGDGERNCSHFSGT